MIRVLLVDDSVLVRHAVAAFLSEQPDMEVVGHAQDGADGLAAFRRLRPDVAVVDLRMPVLDGLAFTRAVLDERPPGRVLVLTHDDGSAASIGPALSAGARGYLAKDMRGDELVRAIRAVAAGQQYLPDFTASAYDEAGHGTTDRKHDRHPRCPGR